MSIASEIQRIQNNIVDAYTSCNSKGATMPVAQNSDNLPACIDSISGGGSSSGYKFGVNVTGGSTITTMVVNNDLVNSLCADWSATSMNSKLKYLSVETVRFTGDWSRGYNYGTIYINGAGQSIRPNTTYTLASDNDYCDIVIASCLTSDTSITLADGGTKPIKRLKVGDKVLSLNPETLEQEEDEIIVADGQINKIAQQYDVWNFENGYVVKTCNRHRFYNVERQAFVYLDEWDFGEHTIVQEGKQVALLSHSIVNEEVQHCTIFTKKWNNYYANGLLSGNRDSSEVHLGTDEQKLIQSQPSANIGTFLGEKYEN